MTATVGLIAVLSDESSSRWSLRVLQRLREINSVKKALIPTTFSVKAGEI